MHLVVFTSLEKCVIFYFQYINCFFKVWQPQTKKFVSAAIFVNNIQRTLYLSPRDYPRKPTEEGEEVTPQKAIDEFNTLRRELGINKMAYVLPLLL